MSKDIILGKGALGASRELRALLGECSYAQGRRGNLKLLTTGAGAVVVTVFTVPVFFVDVEVVLAVVFEVVFDVVFEVLFDVEVV